MIPRDINAIKNKSSGQTFILLHATADDKMTIINPEGKTLTVPGGLFHAPFLVPSSQLSQVFTQAQLSAIINRPSENSRSTKRSGSKLRTTSQAAKKTGIGAQWFSENLTFYKHLIDPLSPSQLFVVEIENKGIFKISKEEFFRIFNDVTISKDYWQNGSFTYSNFPDKALRYVTPSH